MLECGNDMSISSRNKLSTGQKKSNQLHEHIYVDRFTSHQGAIHMSSTCCDVCLHKETTQKEVTLHKP